MLVCNRFFLVFSLLSIFYFIAFLVSRSYISAGNSLSVSQYSVVPFLYCLIYLRDMLFTEINAAAAAAELQSRHALKRY